MREHTIAIYCFIDDFFKIISRKEDGHCKLSDVELLTTALIAARYFHGNLHDACDYMQQHHGVKGIDKSGFTRLLHKLRQQLTSLFLALGNTLKELNTSCSYLIDSFPVAVCDNIRIPADVYCKGKLIAEKTPVKGVTSTALKCKLSILKMACRCSFTSMLPLLLILLS